MIVIGKVEKSIQNIRVKLGDNFKLKFREVSFDSFAGNSVNSRTIGCSEMTRSRLILELLLSRDWLF